MCFLAASLAGERSFSVQSRPLRELRPLASRLLARQLRKLLPLPMRPALLHRVRVRTTCR
jgi:hypothetical protein